MVEVLNRMGYPVNCHTTEETETERTTTLPERHWGLAQYNYNDSTKRSLGTTQSLMLLVYVTKTKTQDIMMPA